MQKGSRIKSKKRITVLKRNYNRLKPAHNNAFWRGAGLKPLSVAALAGLIIIGTPAFASDNIINPHPLADLRRAMSSVSGQVPPTT